MVIIIKIMEMKCKVCSQNINVNSINNITKTKCGCFYHSDCFLKQFASIYIKEDNSKCLRCNNQINNDFYISDKTLEKINKFKNIKKINNFKIVIEC